MEYRLLVLVEYKTKLGCRDAFLKKLAENDIAEKCLHEPDCGQYEFFVPVRAGDSVLLIEKWRCRESQIAHKGFDTYQVLTAIKEKYVRDTIVDMYDL